MHYFTLEYGVYVVGMQTHLKDTHIVGMQTHAKNEDTFREQFHNPEVLYLGKQALLLVDISSCSCRVRAQCWKGEVNRLSYRSSHVRHNSCILTSVHVRSALAGDDADGARHPDVHGPHVRYVQQENAGLRDGTGGVSRYGG